MLGANTQKCANLTGEKMDYEEVIKLFSEAIKDCGTDDDAWAEIHVGDLRKLVNEVFALKVAIASEEGFSKGLLEGVQWLKRDNEQMRAMLSQRG